MNDTEVRFNQNILWAAAIYFASCGLSAIIYPKSWLLVSGLPTTVTVELSLAFGALGAYLLALCFGACIGALAPKRHAGLILTLAMGNLLDFAVTLRAVVAQQLPVFNGGIFLAVAMTWTVLLGLVYVNVKRT